MQVHGRPQTRTGVAQQTKGGLRAPRYDRYDGTQLIKGDRPPPALQQHIQLKQAGTSGTSARTRTVAHTHIQKLPALRNHSQTASRTLLSCSTGQSSKLQFQVDKTRVQIPVLPAFHHPLPSPKMCSGWVLQRGANCKRTSHSWLALSLVSPSPAPDNMSTFPPRISHNTRMVRQSTLT